MGWPPLYGGRGLCLDEDAFVSTHRQRVLIIERHGDGIKPFLRPRPPRHRSRWGSRPAFREDDVLRFPLAASTIRAVIRGHYPRPDGVDPHAYSVRLPCSSWEKKRWRTNPPQPAQERPCRGASRSSRERWTRV